MCKGCVDFSIWANLLKTDQISSFARFAVDEMKVLLSQNSKLILMTMTLIVYHLLSDCAINNDRQRWTKIYKRGQQ